MFCKQKNPDPARARNPKRHARAERAATVARATIARRARARVRYNRARDDRSTERAEGKKTTNQTLARY